MTLQQREWTEFLEPLDLDRRTYNCLWRAMWFAENGCCWYSQDSKTACSEIMKSTNYYELKASIEAYWKGIPRFGKASLENAKKACDKANGLGA